MQHIDIFIAPPPEYEEDEVWPPSLTCAPEEILDGDDIVLTSFEILIHFTYPLRHPAQKLFRRQGAAGGFTRRQLYRYIQRGYQEIYDEEEAAVTAPEANGGAYTGPPLNRPATDGPYGIWGHVFSDLILEGVAFDAETRSVHLTIGS